MNRWCVAVALGCVVSASLVSAAEPEVTSEALKLSMIAESPRIKHATAADIGPDGKVYVIESHTHFPPKDYDGPRADRILVFDPANPDAGPGVFFDKTIKTMGMAWGPKGSDAEGWLYLVGRSEVNRVRDLDNDGKADAVERVLHLETTADYPHNAMAGITFSPDGKTLFIGCGENSGVDYKVVGADGSGFEVNDGTGNIIVCTVDGEKVTRYATGFWNPFGLVFHENGELFAAENDPDASPPCRLIHVVPGGDYGFRFMYGRSGRHPLLAWDGELPGTLGMVSGTGESPCEIVHFKGRLIVASWADHRVEMYTLKPHGGTYKATMKPLVTGGEDFRPVGLTLSPDGKTLYISDWVDRNYTLHGKGRLWRLDGIDEAVEAVKAPAPKKVSTKDGLTSPDPFVRTRAAHAYAPEIAGKKTKLKATLGEIQAARASGSHELLIRDGLASDDPDVRLLTVRWIADLRLDRFRLMLDDVLKDETVMTPQLFACTVAAMAWLDEGKTTAGNGAAPPRQLLDLLRGEDSTDTQRLLALRTLADYDTKIPIEMLSQWIVSDTASEALRLEAMRAMADRGDIDAAGKEKMYGLVASRAGLMTPTMRAEAIVGLAGAGDKYKSVLEALTKDTEPIVAAEAKRALRKGPPAARPAPNDIDAWVKLADGDGDIANGRRLFFHPTLTTCSRCHTVDGYGGQVGPDLSLVGRRDDKRWLLGAILEPSREIPPYYRPWQLTMKDGKTHVGLLRATGGQGGHQPYYDAAGNPFQLPTDQIAERKLLEMSIMPPMLIGNLTDQEVRDLLAFLMSKK